MAVYVPKSEAPGPISPQRRPASAVPKPPRPLDDLEAKWWAFLWRLPVAGIWSASDEAIIYTLAQLYALSEEEMNPGIAAKISIIGSQLGLNPRSRAQLRVEFTEAPVRDDNAVGRERFRAVG
jgi:hypothetical protein